MAVYAFPTVDAFLKAFGQERLKKDAVQGMDWDHVVELQLIRAAVNGTNYNYPEEKMVRLIVFFQNNHNYQSLTPIENGAKGAAITRLINGNPPLVGDKGWITNVRNKWTRLRAKLLQDHVLAFVRSMDQILS